MLPLQVFLLFTFGVYCDKDKLPSTYINVDLFVIPKDGKGILSIDNGSVLLSEEKKSRVKIKQLSEKSYNITIDGVRICRTDELIGECGGAFKKEEFYVKNNNNLFRIKNSPGEFLRAQRCLTYGATDKKVSLSKCTQSKHLQQFVFEIAPPEQKKEEPKKDEPKKETEEKKKSDSESKKNVNPTDEKTKDTGSEGKEGGGSKKGSEKEKLDPKNAEDCIKKIRLNCVLAQPQQHYPNNSPYQYPAAQNSQKQPQLQPSVVIM